MGGVYVVYAIMIKGIVLDDLDPNEFKYVYVGMTNDFERRMYGHFSRINDPTYKRSQKLYNRLRYYGWDNFDKIVLEYGLTREEAIEAEIRLIAKFNTFEQGLNSTPGGDCGSMLCGVDNPRAQAVNVYNNSTGDISSFLWIGDASVYLGVNKQNIHDILCMTKTTEQTYSPVHEAWFQIKKACDDTPFIENMLTRYEKISGVNNHTTRPVKIYNNSTGEIIPFSWIGAAAEYIGNTRKNISDVLCKAQTSDQTYSPIHKAWFQIKYADDDIPFIKDMLTPFKKVSVAKKGEKHPLAKPICVFGKLYPAASVASDILREVCNTTTDRIDFLVDWTRRKKHKYNVFYVSKDFYEKYKDATQCVTKEIYEHFISKLPADVKLPDV